MFNVAIIGCGLIGKKRAASLKSTDDAKLIWTADSNEVNAKNLAREYYCNYTNDWKVPVGDPLTNVIIISTTHDSLAQIAVEAIKKGKHVLVEKPGAKNVDDMKKLLEAAEKNKNVKVMVGFNHRFHPGIQKAKEIVDSGLIGKIMYITARYGHGGRLRYEKEWRMDPEISGGGELLDQGMHLIDLSRYFFKEEIKRSVGVTKTFFWKAPVEDNGFAILETESGKISFLHASWTQWKNQFLFEIHCETGLIVINGLGGSYGKETLTLYRMKPEMGPPDKEEMIFDGEDKSWDLEIKDFIESIKSGKEPNGNLNDAYEALKVVEELYRQ